MEYQDGQRDVVTYRTWKYRQREYRQREFALATVNTTLVSYETKEVTTKYGQKTITDFSAIDGSRYSTWKAEMASQVKLMLNLPVTVEYTTQKNGEYENNYIVTVTSEGEIPEPTTYTPTVAAPQSSKDAQINRAVALKAAVATPLNFESPDQVIALAKVYEEYLNG